MPASATQGFPAPNRNSDPPLKSVVVDVSVNDYNAPNGELITGLNCTVAGVIYLTDKFGTTAPEQMNTGWNPCTACRTIKNSGSNTATVIKAKLAVSN